MIIKTLLSAIVLVVLDTMYLNLVKDYFSKQVQLVQNSPMKVDITAAALCYIFIIFGLNTFVIQRNKSANEAFLLGIVIYAIFELTNKALFNKWSYMTVVMDTLWGGVLFWLTTKIVGYL